MSANEIALLMDGLLRVEKKLEVISQKQEDFASRIAVIYERVDHIVNQQCPKHDKSIGDLDKRVKDLETFKDHARGAVVTASIVSSAMVGVLTFVLNKVF